VSEGSEYPASAAGRKTAVFAIELADAFVSDLKACTRRVQTIQKHVAPRCLQPKLLLILKRTHRGQPAEMMVQRGHPHACDFCEMPRLDCLHAPRLLIASSRPGHRPSLLGLLPFSAPFISRSLAVVSSGSPFGGATSLLLVKEPLNKPFQSRFAVHQAHF
jgi:hypothetical protein